MEKIHNNNNNKNNLQNIENKSLDMTTDQEKPISSLKELEDLRDVLAKIPNNNQNDLRNIDTKGLDLTDEQEKLISSLKELEDMRDAMAKSKEEFFNRIYQASDKHDSPKVPFNEEFPNYLKDKTPEDGIKKLIDAYHSSDIVKQIIEEVGLKNFLSKIKNGQDITPSDIEEIRELLSKSTKEAAIGTQNPENFFDSISSSRPLGKYGDISVNEAIINNGETLNKMKEMFKDLYFQIDPNVTGALGLFYIYNRLVKANDKMLRSRFYLSKEDVSRLSPSQKLGQEIILKNQMRIHRLISAPILALGFFGITWALSQNTHINISFGNKPETVNMDNPVIDDITKSLAMLSLFKGKIGKNIGSVVILSLGLKSFKYALDYLKDFGIDLYDISCIICISLCVFAIAYNIISLILLTHFALFLLIIPFFFYYNNNKNKKANNQKKRIKNDTEISGIFPKFIHSYLISLKTVARSEVYVNFVKFYRTYIFRYFIFLIVCIIARVYLSSLI